MISKTKTVQELQGENYRFLGNEPILLNEPEVVWVVQSGSIALFAIALKNGIPQGTRRYLFNIKAGEAMFSTASREQTYQILAVSLEETEILRMSNTEFEQLLTKEHNSITKLIDRWVDQFGSVIAKFIPESLSVPDTAIQFFSLNPKEVFQPHTNTVSWVRLQQGRARWMGFNQLLLKPTSTLLPLSGLMWLEAEDLVELERLHTQDIQDADIILNGLAELQAYFLQCVDLLQKQEMHEELLRFEERERLNRQMMDETLKELAGVIVPPKLISKQIAIQVSDPSQNLLIAAGAVGHALGITIRPPAKSENAKRVQDPLEAIARSSQIRIRRIQLTDNWWNKDGGPMLTYTLEDESPVALLPISTNAYEIFDPRTQTRQTVNAANAATLSPQAYVFYRPLPDKDLKTLDLLKFAVQGHLKELLIILILGVFVSLLGMLTPQATAILIDNAIPDANQSLLIQIALVLLAAAFGSTLFQLAQGITITRLETFADSSTEAAVWDRLLKLKTSFFRQYSIGDLNSRVQAITEIRKQLGTTVLKTIFTSFFSFLNLGLLFYYNSYLALIACAVAAINVAITIISGILTLRRIRPQLELQGQIFGVMVQLINGVTKLRVAGAEARAFNYWGKQYSQQLKLILSTQGVEDTLAMVNKLLPSLTTALLFWFATGLLQQSHVEGGLSTGTFLAFNAAFGTFIGGTTGLSNTVVDVLQIIPLWQRAQPILKAEPEVNTNKADPGRLSGRVVVDHVVFRYRNDGPLTLDDVSVRAEPGEFIALVGTSGSGKSTLFRLLLGFEFPKSGSIYYDGQDLAGLDIQAVRRQLGVVIQNSRVTSASIFENIACGALVTMEETWEAARMAGFAEDVEAMPMGMHTVVSEGGSNLSGGQRQRLLIARALVLKPRILLFDEATSALDNRTQSIVSKSLERLQVTRIVIAHRLSTIRNANRIYVLQGGRVVQQGSFEQLGQQEGLFQQLMARQSI